MVEAGDGSGALPRPHLLPAQEPLGGAARCGWHLLRAGGGRRPGVYDDAGYVFGTARPRNTRYNGAGLDVSPALNGCLGFAELDGDSDRVDWRFVEATQVPPGPWRKTVTSSPVS